MKFLPLKQAPALIALGTVGFFSLLAAARLDFSERLERMTYDWRARTALYFPNPVATNLAFAQIDDKTIDAVKSGELGYRFGLYWPRQVYGRLVQELAARGAETIAFDVLFGELREDHPSVRMSDESYMESDDYFASEMSRASNVLIAATTNLSPPDLFVTTAAGVGDISTDKDSDGILRRAKAFTWHRQWHPALRELAAKPGSGVNLQHAKIIDRQLVIPLGTKEGGELNIPLDGENNFSINSGEGDTNVVSRKAQAFTMQRVWHMGIMLAARHLKLDLTNAIVDLEHGRITLRGGDGIERIIPVDPNGFFYVDWTLRPDDPRLTVEPVDGLLRKNRTRALGQALMSVKDWRGKLVVVGSSALGNDLTDLGATPLDKSTLLVSKHWNVANSVLTGRFIKRVSAFGEILIIGLLGLTTAWLTWQLRVLPGLLSVMALAVAYSVVCVALFIQLRLWMPMVLPIVGALFVKYLLLVTYRVVFEQREQRRVKGIFSKVVSPNVAKELLGRDEISLSGVRSEITVLFADIRGFTELTDMTQEQVAENIRFNNLDAKAAEAAYNESARETLNTVNAYLAIVADTVKKHDGTLDKYIGDCVMAFWGAPTAQQGHALACVRAAIEAQRAIYELNLKRAEENRQGAIENEARTSAGLLPKPLLPTLSLGTGINTGVVTVGLMGSNAHILNYTVFGREVNLASRLEGVSGRGRIVIGVGTYQALLRDDPKLAATCVELEPTKPKGFQKPVRNFEVPWQTAG